MSLDPDEIVSLSLAGTVALPSPFPACGAVNIIVQEVGGEVVEVFLKVTHRVNRRLKVARIVALDLVRVILAPKSLAPEGYPAERPEPGAGGELVATTSPLREAVRDRIRDALAQRKKSHEKDPHLPPLGPIRLVNEAILYVPEWAPVLMDVEVSMTAAESANYYPPMAARESHAFFCDDFEKKKTRCDSHDK